ncbi:hypothetical protein WR25_24808 [Diploscapter pachys]|uniref:Uncharacterized protein n=1 Tax=Diploscapter pachys TaxID=2018661 RepID=A0A2A2M3V9_9BILA|nr:hypothetical protein WR25_24808 [Diploscapter pachys]
MLPNCSCVPSTLRSVSAPSGGNRLRSPAIVRGGAGSILTPISTVPGSASAIGFTSTEDTRPVWISARFRSSSDAALYASPGWKRAISCTWSASNTRLPGSATIRPNRRALPVATARSSVAVLVA